MQKKKFKIYLEILVSKPFKCGRPFECYTRGVFQSGKGRALQDFPDDSVFCNSCLLEL